jgi:hypothetical protein
MQFQVQKCSRIYEDTERVIRIRKLKKDIQHNGQRKKDKRTNNDQQNIHIKLKIEMLNGVLKKNAEVPSSLISEIYTIQA